MAGRRQDWIGVDPFAMCKVTDEELAEAERKARADIIRGATPVPKGTTPHALFTIGAPGAGKTMLARSMVGRDYLVIDLDLAVKYHPRLGDIWSLPSAATGERIPGVGAAMAMTDCNEAVIEILEKLFLSVLQDRKTRYNFVFQSHRHQDIITAKEHGYRVTLLYVGVPMEVAIQRARDRAVETGMFLAPTLHEQGIEVARTWLLYLELAPWYGLWADEFLVADNSRPWPAGKIDSDAVPITRFDLHGADWEKRMAMAKEAIDATAFPAREGAAVDKKKSSRARAAALSRLSGPKSRTARAAQTRRAGPP